LADCCSPTFLFVLIRSVHYASCLLLLAVWAFHLFVLPAVWSSLTEAFRARWQTLEARSTLLLLPIIAISGVAWFAVLCVNMSGLPFKQAMQPETVRAVWSQTHFGSVWQVRLVIWLGALYMPIGLSQRMPRIFLRMSAWVNLLLAGALASSLAWAGHGEDGGDWHLLADAIHLLIAGFWPLGLAPLALMFFEMRRIPLAKRRMPMLMLVRRFSMLSLCSVSILMITGVTNSLFMIGRVADLVQTGYGRVLLLKIFLFLLMVCLGAVNLLRLKPRLAHAASTGAADSAAEWLQWNVLAEISLGLFVLVVTAILGLLPPGHP
jgi:putative copper export protein